MAETPEAKLSRVRQMINDDGGTWDLSPNDKAALCHVLGLVNQLADEVGQRTATTCEDVIDCFGEVVARIQESRNG